MEDRTIERHRRLFDPAWFNPRRATVLGVGAGGLTVALLLAKLGVQNMLICDTDVVEPENLGPSLYGWQHVGERKIDACARVIRESAHLEIEATPNDALELGSYGDAVFLCVDSNDLRKKLVERFAFGDTGPQRIFEGRMSARFFLNHSFDPRNDEHVRSWLRYWVPDSEVGEALPGCGAIPVAVSTAAMLSASLLVQHFIDWVSHEAGRRTAPLQNQVFFDLERYVAESSSWD